MKSKISISFVLLLMMLVFSACSKETVDTSKLNIVTSFYPMYIATANIVDGVEEVELRNLTATTTGCLHDYQLTTANMITLTSADVLVINGEGMETFIEKAIETCENLKIVEASEGILESHEKLEHIEIEESHIHEEVSKIEYNEEEIHEEQDGHEHHHGENAHIWVSLSLHMEQVENICDELIKIDPKNAGKYRENAQNYIGKLKALKEKMHMTLDGKTNKNIVTFHEAFEFFAEEFDLEIVAVIEREPGTYPSAGEVADIIDLVREKNAKAIFVEPQYSRSAADTIARETDVPVYSLDPIVTGELDKDAYLKRMEMNLKTLEEALS